MNNEVKVSDMDNVLFKDEIIPETKVRAEREKLDINNEKSKQYKIKFKTFVYGIPFYISFECGYEQEWNNDLDALKESYRRRKTISVTNVEPLEILCPPIKEQDAKSISSNSVS